MTDAEIDAALRDARGWINSGHPPGTVGAMVDEMAAESLAALLVKTWARACRLTAEECGQPGVAIPTYREDDDE